MILALPDEVLSPNPFTQFEAPFMVAMRTFETAVNVQLEWWRAWCGLLGQLAPLPPQVVEDKPASEPEGD